MSNLAVGRNFRNGEAAWMRRIGGEPYKEAASSLAIEPSLRLSGLNIPGPSVPGVSKVVTEGRRDQVILPVEPRLLQDLAHGVEEKSVVFLPGKRTEPTENIAETFHINIKLLVVGLVVVIGQKSFKTSAHDTFLTKH